MNRNLSLVLGFFCLGLLVGCDKKPTENAKKDEPKNEKTSLETKGKPKDGEMDEHEHGPGPNGGVVFDLGKYHAEFTVDHDKKSCRILFVTEDAKDGKPLPVKATEFLVTTKPTKTKEGKDVPAMTIKMKATDAKDGKAATFIGEDAGLANVADFEGAATGEIDGKPASGKFKE